MAKVNLKDFYGRIMGSLDDQGDKVVARDFYNKILGSYNKIDGKTRDFYGRVIADGDVTASLVAQAHYEYENKK